MTLIHPGQYAVTFAVTHHYTNGTDETVRGSVDVTVSRTSEQQQLRALFRDDYKERCTTDAVQDVTVNSFLIDPIRTGDTSE